MKTAAGSVENEERGRMEGGQNVPGMRDTYPLTVPVERRMLRTVMLISVFLGLVAPAHANPIGRRNHMLTCTHGFKGSVSRKQVLDSFLAFPL